MDPRLFETLGLGPSASIADVRSAYRKLARRYHPDVAGARGVSKFAEISRAHDLLIQHLEAAREAPLMPDSGSYSAFSPIFDFQNAPAHGFSAPVREGGSDFIDDTVSDIFEDIDNMISSIGGVFGDTRRR